MKKKGTAMTAPMSNKKDTPSVTLPHLVYKLDFHETEMSEQSVWEGNDILAGIIKQSNDEFDESNQKEKKTESKVIVVLELPSGGVVSKFVVGDNDDTLEVEVQKHTLMLHPKALLFSGIRAGVLDEATDGPNTARGGIRLSECAKALREYRAREKSHNTTNGKKGQKKLSNSLHLIFDLPDYVDRDSVDYYSYCFEQSQNNLLQYAISYFEFDVKDPNEAKKKKEDKFTTASSMIFDSGANQTHGSSRSTNSSTHQTNHHNNSSTSSSGNMQSSSSSSATSQGFSNSFNANDNDDEDVDMNEDKADDDEESEASIRYSQSQVDRMKKVMLGQLKELKKTIQSK